LYQLEFSNTYLILKENLLNILLIDHQARQVFEKYLTYQAMHYNAYYAKYETSLSIFIRHFF
jgi:hypothetical protein